MKKAIPVIIAVIFIINGFGAVGSKTILNNEKENASSNNFEIIIPISNSDIEEIIIKETDKGQLLELEENNYLLNPGKPKLPVENFIIALPQEASLISINLKDLKTQFLPDTYKIAPVDYFLPKDNLDSNSYMKIIDEWKIIQEDTYTNNYVYPIENIILKNSGNFGKLSYITIQFCPFNYYPESGELEYIKNCDLIITYEFLKNDNDFIQNEIIESSDSYIEISNPILFDNYYEMKEYFEDDLFQSVSAMDSFDFVIITTDELSAAITSSDFIDWKSSLGFNIKIISITDDEIINQPGNDLAEQIRNFLRENYLQWGIKYVLFVGDYETIPMRYCYPNPSNHRFDPFDFNSGEVPTDYYYADLSSADYESWDSDGDGFYGEYGEDSPDFLADVYIGRIPTSIASRVEYTLDKTVSFEQDKGAWKKHALHAGAFFYFTDEDNSGWDAMDGAQTLDYIERNIMDGWTISHYSEQAGIEISDYNWPALTEDAFIDDWRNGKYSIINWQGHGWTNVVARKVWSSDDGDGIPEGNEMSWIDFINVDSNLDDDYPSIVTAVSCYVGCPEIGQGGRNLGIDLLTNPSLGASVGVISSARSPYGSLDWPETPGGSDAIIYEFNKNMIIDEQKVGEAFYNSKFYCNQEWGWDSYIEYIDMLTFNLYGDPSLTFEGISENNYPNKPILEGPTSGKSGTEYEYSAKAIDPDNDQLYYMFDWGDGTDSNWLGPYDSGFKINSSHVWNSKGEFEIRVKVKDERGAESDWAILEVNMPKNIWFIGRIISKLIERFTIFDNLFQ